MTRKIANTSTFAILKVQGFIPCIHFCLEMALPSVVFFKKIQVVLKYDFDIVYVGQKLV